MKSFTRTVVFILSLLSIFNLGGKVRKAPSGTGTVVGTCSLPDTSQWDGIAIVVAGQNRSTTTNGLGHFVLTNVGAGPIHIQAGKLSYENAAVDTILVAAETLHVNFALTTVIVDTFAGQSTAKFSSASTNVGNIGVPNRFILPGDSGFAWAGQQQLKEGSLMIGVNTNRVSDAARFILGIAQDNLDQDFLSRSDVVVLSSGPDSTVHVTSFDDSRANQPPGNPSQPLGILVTQKTSSYGAPGNQGYMVVDLSILNAGTSTLSDMLVGWFVDWDAGASGSTNRGQVVFVNQQIDVLNNGLPFPVEIAYQTASTAAGPFVGVVPLSQAQFRASRIASIQNEIAPTAADGGLTESNKYVYMRDRRPTNTYTDAGVEEDLSTIVSMGGTQSDNYGTSYFTSSPGTIVHVGFAFVGGADSAELVQNALAAQRKWVQEGNTIDIVPSTWQVDARWNLLSIPVFVSDSSKATLFPSALSYAFSYVPAVGYNRTDTLSTGMGFWLQFPSPTVVSIPGAIRRVDTITVVAGWNIIGTLSYPVAREDVVTIPAGIIQGNLFGYNGLYQVADTLYPLRGYWLKVSQAGKVILSAPPPPASTH